MTFDPDQYAALHSDPEPEYLRSIWRRAHLQLLNPRMNSGHLQGRLLTMFTRMIRPVRVLELGTFAGYSALCLAEGVGPGGEVVTIEANDELEDFIRDSLASSPHGDKVKLLFGDALEVMRTLPDASFEMIFIDADKRAYCDYYEEAKRLAAPGAFILADNTLWSGHLEDPKYSRDAQTQGVNRFNELVASDPDVERVLLSVRDGLTLIRKIPPKVD